MQVFLSRAEYDKTLPWSSAALLFVNEARCSATLAGFTYTFVDPNAAAAFKLALLKNVCPNCGRYSKDSKSCGCGM